MLNQRHLNLDRVRLSLVEYLGNGTILRVQSFEDENSSEHVGRWNSQQILIWKRFSQIDSLVEQMKSETTNFESMFK